MPPPLPYRTRSSSPDDPVMRHALPLALLAALAAAPPARQSPYAVEAPAPAGFDRAAAAAATLAHLEALIPLDTRNPPGNEMLTARYLERALAGVPGVTTEVLDVGDNRANFVARLAATSPGAPPVLVLGHMDVVGFQEANWSTAPLTPTRRDGYLYGRGAIDDKGMLAAAAAVLVQLAARRDALQRDVILLATAAEEGGPAVGVDWVLEHRPDVLGGAQFALNEGGRVRLSDGVVRTVNVQTTEKVYYEVAAVAAGPSGHGSVPLPDNALAALARAAARVHDWRAPVALNETTRVYFRRMASIEEDPLLRGAMAVLGAAEPPEPAALEAAAQVAARDPFLDAILRTGQSLTVLDGGFRANVIPSEGRATFNVRTVPGDDVRAVVRRMQEVGGEPSVRFELQGEPRSSPPPSPVGTPLFRALEEASRAMAPAALVVPFMSTGATDGAALRAAGIPTYGILPFPLELEDERRLHGDDERVPLEALGWGAEYLYRTLAAVALGS